MDVHGYTETGSISVTHDGRALDVPDRAGNRHRQMVAAWEAEGNTIPPYQGPSDAELRAHTRESRAVIAARIIADDPTYQAELEAWALAGDIPARALAAFGTLDLVDQARATTSVMISRNSPLVAVFGQLYGYDTDAKLDALFGIGVTAP